MKSEKLVVSNFGPGKVQQDMAIGKDVQVTYRYPLSLNSSYSYSKSAFKLELGECDFYFHDQQLQKMLSFFLMIRLVNTIRSFIKKHFYELGKFDDKFIDQSWLDLYSFQSKDKVETTLVPNVCNI